MGYDLNRFIGEIHDEFQCSICKMVLEDPVQTTCEHSFCRNCIKEWLSNTQTCPVDRMPLTISDLKPANRPFRNLWNRLDVKCDFESKGCSASTKLENLAFHVSSCEYNLNSEIVCDKGCNMTITRRDYHANNCFSHLANRVSAQGKEIIKMSDQKKDFERIVNRLQDQNRHEIGKLYDEVRGLNENIRRLNDEINRQFDAAMKTQQQQTAELNFSLRPLKWKHVYNVNIDPTNILKVDDPTTTPSIVTSHYALKPEKPNFEVHILNISNSAANDSNYIGLEYRDGKILFCYQNNGDINSSEGGPKYSYAPKWKSGDIIECGVTFPKNIISNGDYRATVYCSRNKEIFFNEYLTIPEGGIYPYVLIKKDTKVQYCQ